MADGNDPCRVCGGNLWMHTREELQRCGVVPDPQAATIARLTRERDEARATYDSASREWAERHEHARARILGLTRERDEASRERDRYRAALTDVAREWPYLDLIDPEAVQEGDLRGVIDYLLRALSSEQRTAREALEGQTDA